MTITEPNGVSHIPEVLGPARIVAQTVISNRPIHGHRSVDACARRERNDDVAAQCDVVAWLERLFVNPGRQSHEDDVRAVVLRGRAIVTLEREEAILGVEQVPDALPAHGVCQ